MKVLVTGSRGQLGRDLVPCLEQAGHQVTTATREQLDFSKPSQIAKTIGMLRPEWVVNCAAYTKVDQAESEAECAFRINRDSVAELAIATAAYGGRILHLSTDYIFDGRQYTPYCEDDIANPINVYGRSKWEGEHCLLQYLPDAAVIRTSWVYGANGHNFVKTILKLALEKESLRVVDDQMGSPTWTRDIARAIRDLIQNKHKGVFHFTNEGIASWYDLAVAVVEEANRLGFMIKVKSINPVSTEAYPLPAKRPHYSVLSKKKIRPLLSSPIPYWRESLKEMLKEFKE